MHDVNASILSHLFELAFILTRDNRLHQWLTGCGIVVEFFQGLSFAFYPDIAFGSPLLQNILYQFLLPWHDDRIYWAIVILVFIEALFLLKLGYEHQKTGGIQSLRILVAARVLVGALGTILFFPVLERLLEPLLPLGWAPRAKRYGPDVDIFAVCVSTVSVVLFYLPALAVAGLFFEPGIQHGSREH